ncbi:sorbitol dehydrogenase-like isoform X1 [Rhynchophorus ferrugineus]|uniref:Sorbitol dehydrogenase n=1 Tax=Rhynchophorus ferrugineus TaxID=354439 RepID=A0A834M052_RHYFE|nr:hypothetical protein GWI33_020847 [Rhynchophorus ferrugineus]
MAFKITQCIIPFMQQNKQNLLQVINGPHNKNSFGTSRNYQNKDDHAHMSNKAGVFLKKPISDCKSNTGHLGENLAAILYGKNDLRMEQRPIPTILPNQVLLQMEVCGICGTDVHFLEDGKLGSWSIDKPIVIGHEASGTILECGSSVKHLKIGDKVAVEPQSSCRMCIYCKTGNYHMCPNLYFCAAPPNDGNLCRYYAHDADFCHKLPCNLDLEHGCLMEPLAVGVHGCKKGHITSGDFVLIIGAGPVGLASLLASRAYGASTIIVVDIDDFKLEKSIEMGADCAINVNGLNEHDAVQKIHDIFGEAPNKTLECCGFKEALRIGLLATRSCGKMVLLGLGETDVQLPIMESVYKEIDVIGAIRYANDYQNAIDMVAKGKVDPKPLITHHFKLEDAVKAYETAAKREEKYIKIVIHANPNWQSQN